jgi:hypothetical protein
MAVMLARLPKAKRSLAVGAPRTDQALLLDCDRFPYGKDGVLGVQSQHKLTPDRRAPLASILAGYGGYRWDIQLQK